MKTILKFIGGYLIVFAFVYLAVSFVVLELNPELWHEDARVGVIFGSIVLYVVIKAFYNIFEI
jgi:hypothetical protein